MFQTDQPTVQERRRPWRVRWQYVVGASIVAACAVTTGIAAASTSMDSLDELSGGGGSYTFSCDTTITGTHGALTVTSGVTCVLHATITGGISVASGASVIVQNSTVNGSISEHNPDGTQICGSTISGGVAIVGSTDFVLVGDPANGCKANTITGSLLAANNQYGLVIVKNTIKGSLSTPNNSGSGPLPGQTGPIVSGNHS